MHDGIAFESAGKPATTVVTEAFVSLAKAKRASMNLDEYDFIVVPHPMGNGAGIREKAEVAASQVVKALTGG